MHKVKYSLCAFFMFIDNAKKNKNREKIELFLYLDFIFNDNHYLQNKR